MKIGLNATCLNNRPSGAKQRFVEIYRELVKALPQAEFVVYEPSDCRVGEWFNGAPNVSARRTPLPSEGRVRRLICGLNYWRTELERERFDVFEGFNLPLIKAPTGRTLLTVYDIRGLHPDNGMLKRAVAKMVLARSLAAADHVVTISQAMKAELLGHLAGVPVSAIYCGVNTTEMNALTKADLLATGEKYRLPQQFILAVGHLERRKNYLQLIDAIARLRDRGHTCALLIVGNDSGQKQAMQERVESLHLAGSVQILSGLSDLEVRCVYKLCRLFVFPSTYEGFGIPILEAMAANCPMVLSDIPVFREITQNKGVYFPPDDAEAMASAIEKVLTSSSERARLVAYGKERVKAFSFQSLAGQMAQLYQSLMQQSACNIDVKTVASFGDEWSRFDQKAMPEREAQKMFEEYFAVFPWSELPENAEGFDMGCGSGRWARWVAPKVGRLHCIDPSDAVEVAKANLASYDNLTFHRASVDARCLPPASQDFGYSLGVLHHVPDTQAAIRSCVELLKPGAPLLLYLYYAFDNRSWWFRAVWRMSDLGRRLICKLPPWLKHAVTDVIALLVYLPLATVSRVLERLGCNVAGIPLSYYRKHSFYTMRTDARDRFGTPLEHRFTRGQITEMMERAGLVNVRFSDGAPFWCAVGEKAWIAALRSQ